MNIQCYLQHLTCASAAEGIIAGAVTVFVLAFNGLLIGAIAQARRAASDRSLPWGGTFGQAPLALHYARSLSFQGWLLRT
jgi:hypothetical protein